MADSVSTTLKKINFLCFPIIKTALRILARVPDASCACERSFSSIKLLKVDNRSTMTNDGLSALALLNIFLDLRLWIHKMRVGSCELRVSS